MVGPITPQQEYSSLGGVSKSFVKRMMVGLLLINLFVFTWVGMSMRHSYLHYREQVELNTQNLTRVLENEIAGHIRAVDVALIDVIEEYQEQYGGSLNKKAFDAHLQRWRTRLPEIDALRISDAHGIQISSNDISPVSRIGDADQPYFLRLRENPGQGLVIAQPQVVNTSQKQGIVLARSIALANGEFGGIVCAAISLEHLSRTFPAIDVGPHGTIELRDGDLDIVTRHPGGTQREIGWNGSPRGLLDMAREGRKSVTYRDYPGTDNIERAFTYRQVDAYPLMVAVGLAPSDYLDEWQQQVFKALALAALFFSATLFSAWLFHRGWRHQATISDQLGAELGKRQRVEGVLRRELDFVESLIETAQTIVLVMDVEGRIVRINGHLEKLTGYSRDEVLGKDWFTTFLPPAAQESCKVVFQNAINDIHTNGNVNAILTRDGREKLIEWYDKTLKDVDGHAVGLLAIGLDVTERKQAEKEIFQYRDRLEEKVAARTKELVATMEKLQEVERREHIMLENLPVGVRLSSDDETNTLYLNPFFVEMFGYSIEDIPTLSQWWELAYPDPEYRAWVSAEYQRHLAIAKSEKCGHEPLEVQITAKDGTVKYTRVHITFMDGLHFVTFIDLSDRKWAENALVNLNDSLAQRVAERTQELTRKAAILEEEIKNRRKLEIHLLLVSEEERLHLGSELHDNVGQTLTAIGFFASALYNELSKAGSPSGEKAKHIAALVGDATRTVRYLSNGLIQFDIARQGLAPSLAHLAGDVSGVSGIPCEFRSTGNDTIEDFAIVTHLFRIAQEALNNALKHSSASKLTVDLESNDQGMRLVVMDDGIGCPGCVAQEGKSRGLMTMEYRAKLIGATLTITAAQPQGTAVTVVLPPII